jgi:beta-glucosidase
LCCYVGRVLLALGALGVLAAGCWAAASGSVALAPAAQKAEPARTAQPARSEAAALGRAAPESLSGGASHVDVDALVDSLSGDERILLLHGLPSACQYTGLTRNLSHAGMLIPELRMNDGPQGFRGPDRAGAGLSTQHPCALSLAASWDPSLVERWASSMAREFKGKGANVFLGPGLNVARVPWNGRNFEYLSGEDPVLGAAMGAASVRGVQSVAGMIATAKHFALNNQEAARQQVNVEVGDVPLNELYLAPFRAAVRAGAGAVMCAYNRVRGRYACENQELLTRKLRTEWGFKGFVVSDWGATHSARPALLAGLDQEMPGGSYFDAPLRDAARSDPAAATAVRTSARRVLEAMRRAQLLGTADPPCAALANVTSEAADALAREAATAGAVLLRNEAAALPFALAPGRRVALLGRASFSQRDVVGGGSGYVDAGSRGHTAEAGLREHLGARGVLLDAVRAAPGAPEFAAALQAADAVVVVLAQSSTEGVDRSAELAYAEDQLALLRAAVNASRAAGGAAAKSRPVIAVCVAPGAVALPFLDDVQALLLMFMPGQAFGLALADMLTGQAEPGGRLPISIARPGAGVRFSEDQYPGLRGTANYSEGLLVGYRWHDHHRVAPQFAFGFGLGYTRFAYEPQASIARVPLKRPAWLVTASVRNLGQREGHEVLQVYLAREACAPDGEQVTRPPKKLVAFRKLRAKPQQAATARIILGLDQLGEWSVATEGWVWPQSKCTYALLLGGSSADLPLRLPIDFQGLA